MRKTDINNYQAKQDDKSKSSTSAVKPIISAVMKTLLTVLLIVFIAGVIVCFNMLLYLVRLASQPSGIDLDARSLNLSSFVYVQDPDTGDFYEYQSLYGSENRVWVDYNEMPKAMIDAIIAIEDKRFYQHNGVDWLRTGSAVVNLAGGDDSYGGSTLTQQLIKNLTEDDEVSINRKIREIVKALKVEKEYTKDEIVEAYLNVVNFGGSCQGVQAAAQRYFGKDIADCSIAECASIAGITQNPSKWNPLIYPENNMLRREIVLYEMYDQGKITKDEYDAALKESDAMSFEDRSLSEDSEASNVNIQNWYLDELLYDLSEDLAKFYNISESAARDKILGEGLNIYCAMDLEAQQMIEKEALNIDKTNNSKLEIAMTMMDYNGRVIATVGSSNKKDGNLVFDRATMSALQPGSSIKPVVAYPCALEQGHINYSSYIPDETLDAWIYGDGSHGPTNWYGYYHSGGLMTVDAIEWSSNACAAQALEMMGGPLAAYNHATSYLGFEHLNPDQDPYAYAGFSLGGMNGGVTVREMANAFTYIGNGGLNYEPYTYYYVTDRNGQIIIDNRNEEAIQAYSEETASIMNRMLYNNVTNCVHTAAGRARVSGWEIAGKTGTTNSGRDIWFCGASPYCTLAVWTGFNDPDVISYPGTVVASNTFSTVMSNYLADKEHKDFDISSKVLELEYCTYTGLLASDSCTSTKIGYYSEDNIPEQCLSHSGYYIGSDSESETTSGTGTTENATGETQGNTGSIIIDNPTGIPDATDSIEPAE